VCQLSDLKHDAIASLSDRTIRWMMRERTVFFVQIFLWNPRMRGVVPRGIPDGISTLATLKSAHGRAAGWITFTGLAVHLGALCAFIPGTFHWSGLFVMMALCDATGAWCISLGYHRMLTHRSFKLWKPLEYATSLLGLALQGGPIA
jgi:hypothetical protein